MTIFEEFTQPGLVVGHKSDHASTWEALWNDKTFTDITLVSNDQITFHFHKAVLAAVSPIFRTMLSSSFKEAKENRIDIHFSRSIIYSAMRWIYLGETQSVGKLTSEEAVSLLQFCIMYEMFELADVAIAQIVNMLTCANLKQISQLADLHAEATNALLQPLIERLRTEIDFFISTHSDDLVKQWMKDAPASVSASGKRRADTESTKPEIKRLKASNSLEEID